MSWKAVKAVKAIRTCGNLSDQNQSQDGGDPDLGLLL